MLLFAGAFFAVRLPFLVAGYGADTDAYRVALAARYLWSSGEYLPSRLPGYPLHELPVALLVWGGPLLTNLATALVAFAGVLIFDRIVVALGVPGRGWLLVAMGFTPWLLVTSTATLDHHWALTAMLAAYLATIRERFVLAGLLLGVAAGCRITAAAFLLPLSVLVIWHWRALGWDVVLRRLAVLCGVAGVVGLAAYVPAGRAARARRHRRAGDARGSGGIVAAAVGVAPAAEDGLACAALGADRAGLRVALPPSAG
jgi:hypothetical protein